MAIGAVGPGWPSRRRKAARIGDEAEELERHRDHQKPGEDGEEALAKIEGAARQAEALRRADDLAEHSRKHAQKAIGGQAAGVVEQMAHDGRAAAAGVAADRAGKAAAHADAVKAACETGAEEQQILTHGTVDATSSHPDQDNEKDDEADRAGAVDQEAEYLRQAGLGEGEDGFL
jgi:hypothetical protein